MCYLASRELISVSEKREGSEGDKVCVTRAFSKPCRSILKPRPERRGRGPSGRPRRATEIEVIALYYFIRRRPRGAEPRSRQRCALAADATSDRAVERAGRRALQSAADGALAAGRARAPLPSSVATAWRSPRRGVESTG